MMNRWQLNGKRAAAWICGLALTLGLSGCTAEIKELPLFQSVSEKFDAFVEELPAQFISNDNYSLNLLFNDPQAYGFEEELYVWPYSDWEDYEGAGQEAEELLAQLHRFNRERLDSSQRLTYDMLEDYLERSQLTNDYYDLDNSYLGSFTGFQAEIPVLLNEFKFNRRSDLDSYFNLLETAEETFLRYAALEKERLEHGAGMSQVTLDAVIGQCEAFAAEENPFLIESINAKIDGMDFLSPSEKIEMKTRNEFLLKNDFLNAYRTLGEELSKLEGRKEELGLSSLPDGKAYYEALIRQKTGADLTVEEARTYAQEHLQKYATEFQELLAADPSLYERFLEADLVFADFTTAEENLDYLEQAVQADFPPVASLNYNVIPVPEAMQENFSPAAYVSNPIDAPLDTPESIYLNGDYDQSLFPTMAHEGYPGHMYQSAYFTGLQMPAVRYFMEYTGYTEGWAVYVENHIVRYAPENRDLLELWAVNQQAAQMYLCLMEIGVHEDGWDRARFAQEYRDVFGAEIPDEVCGGMFELILEMPGYYLQYFLTGALFEDCYDRAEESLGEAFSPADYHKMVLDLGSVSFEILERQVDSYIQTNRQSLKAAA